MINSHDYGVESKREEVQSNDSEEQQSDLWTIDDDEKLSEAVELFTDPNKLKRKRIDWDAVSKYMDISRTAKQCYSRWTTTAMHSLDGRKVGPWDSEEDAKLIEEVERQKRNNNMKVSWQEVSVNVNIRRNRKQCMARYVNVLQYRHTCATKKVGAWDSEEDSKLIEAVEMFRGKGRKNGIPWGEVVTLLNNTRSQKQCKKRWDDAFADIYKTRVVSPSVVTDDVSEEEHENAHITAGPSTYGNYCSGQTEGVSSFGSSFSRGNVSSIIDGNDVSGGGSGGSSSSGSGVGDSFHGISGGESYNYGSNHEQVGQYIHAGDTASTSRYSAEDEVGTAGNDRDTSTNEGRHKKASKLYSEQDHSKAAGSLLELRK